MKILYFLIVTSVALCTMQCKPTAKEQQQQNTASESHSHDGHDHGTTGLKNEENQKLLEEVMTIHDELMPQMGRLNTLQQKMTTMAEKTKNKAEKEQMLDIAHALDKADEAMFVWMEKFPSDISKFTDAEAKQILVAEKVKVEAMRQQFQNAFKQADDFILKIKK